MGKPIPSEIAQQIADQVFAGNTIAAIKLHRECSGEGLKESRDFVKSLEAELRIREPYRFTRGSEGKDQRRRLPLCVCAIVAVLLAVFLWPGTGGASIRRRFMTSARSVSISLPAIGVSTPAVTQTAAQPTEHAVQPDVEVASVPTHVVPQPKQYPAPLAELSGSWHVMKPPKMDLRVTLTRIDDRHYRLTPARLALQGVYAWDGKTLSMESGNQAYRDLTWELTPSIQFVMVKGAYKGATMTRE